jgi:polysaccharide biosynthesis protein PslG
MKHLSKVTAWLLGVALSSVAIPALAGPGWLADQTIGDSFGVQVKEWQTTPVDLDNIKSAGFGVLRYGIGWPYVERERGAYKWAEYDKFIEQVRLRKLRSIVILAGGNQVYSGVARAPSNERSLDRVLAIAPDNDDAIRGFARFAAAAAERYQGNDIIWEVWNEPDLSYFWPPKSDLQAYVKLALAACLAIRKVDPSATIIGPAAAGMPGWRDRLGVGLMAAVLRSSLASCFDAMSFHSYRVERNSPPKAPESVIADNEAASNFIAARTPAGHPTFPLVSSEWGYNTVELTETQQAEYVLRTHLSNLLSGVAISVWYEWRDSGQGSNNTEAHYGLIDSASHDKQAIRTVRDILPQIRDDRIDHRLATNDRRDYVVSLRSSTGARKLVAWTTRDPLLQSPLLEVVGQRIHLSSMPRVIHLDGSRLTHVVVSP